MERYCSFPAFMEHTLSEHYLTGKDAGRGNFVLAVIAGLSSSILSALIWLAIDLITGWHSAFSALGVAVLIGLSIRLSGQGSDFIYGVLGIIFTLLGCLAGEIGVSLQLATTPWFDMYGVLMHVDVIAMTFAILSQVTPLMMVVYGIASFEAYMLSIEK